MIAGAATSFTSSIASDWVSGGDINWIKAGMYNLVNGSLSYSNAKTIEMETMLNTIISSMW